ncbi:MAG TPA: hypothetical protein VH394_01550 [Thermoanaerobaculia bacterium]|jgi:ribosomal protein L7/L12|nr:hypothetical protein [Thermoanaerobaculia bacterium]
MTSPDWLPPEVISAIESGQTIEAVKLLRESRGLGLAEAKEAVDAFVRRQKAPEAASASETSPSPEVMQALRNGNKIEAVHLVREQRGLSLRDAKLLVDSMEANQQPMPSGSPAPAPMAPRKLSGLLGLLVILVIVAAYLAYRFWGGE